MTVTDQIKIIDNKIKANQAQYHLDILAAKISALSFGELRKYEYLTGEDLGHRPHPSEFGKKTDSKKMLSHMKIMMAKHKLQQQKYAFLY